MEGRIKTGKDPKTMIACVAGAIDEVVSRDTYVLNDTATSVLTSPALLKIKSGVTNDDIKVTLWSGTLLTMKSDDVNESNVHVKKVWDTGTSLTTADFYLWQ